MAIATAPTTVMTVKEAKAITGGGLTKVSKMPSMTYNIPATRCKTGSKLRARGRKQLETTGTTNIPCGHCYVYGHNWRYENVQRGMERRYQSLTHPEWVEAMALLINRDCAKWQRKHPSVPHVFRWHASGDVQDLGHMERIAAVCALTPDTAHWLPTQERPLMQQYLKVHGSFPSNLCVRISAAVIGGHAGTYANDPHRQASMISLEPVAGAHNCPAPQQGNECRDCRACWQKSVPLVAYHLH